MGAAERQAIWSREKAEGRPPRPTFGTRTSWAGHVNERKPGGWCVVKVNTDGRRLVVRDGLKYAVADIAAGRMRDGMSERDVADGWNYIAERRQKTESP